jgi:hypothetical protein
VTVPRGATQDEALDIVLASPLAEKYGLSKVRFQSVGLCIVECAALTQCMHHLQETIGRVIYPPKGNMMNLVLKKG